MKYFLTKMLFGPQISSGCFTFVREEMGPRAVDLEIAAVAPVEEGATSVPREAKPHGSEATVPQSRLRTSVSPSARSLRSILRSLRSTSPFGRGTLACLVSPSSRLDMRVSFLLVAPPPTIHSFDRLDPSGLLLRLHFATQSLAWSRPLGLYGLRRGWYVGGSGGLRPPHWALLRGWLCQPGGFGAWFGQVLALFERSTANCPLSSRSYFQMGEIIWRNRKKYIWIKML